MKKVYVTNKGPHNYSDAEAFGVLAYITDGLVDKFDISQMYRSCDEAMADSEPDDYILLTSLTSLCSVACAYFAAKHGELHVLIHKGDGYVERSIYFTE